MDPAPEESADDRQRRAREWSRAAGSVLLGAIIVWGWQTAPVVTVLAGSALLLAAVVFVVLRVFELLLRNIASGGPGASTERVRPWLVLLACLGIGLVGGALLRNARIARARTAAGALAPLLERHRDQTGRYPAALTALPDAPDPPAFAAPTFYAARDDGDAYTLTLRAETGFVPEIWTYDSKSGRWSSGN